MKNSRPILLEKLLFTYLNDVNLTVNFVRQ